MSKQNSTKASENLNRILEKAKKIPFEVLPSPLKSTRDKKAYKVIKLQNGLRACLISDVGSYKDDDTFSDSSDSDLDSSESGSEDLAAPNDDGPESDNELKKQKQTKEKMAAAALCVGVGSFSDPLAIPGMAHFLEHMVFMGSEKFPEENDFDKYISKRGGSDNASTDCETTTFYFECFEKYLYNSLDKFAQFFISPLMKRESMTREREAIDSEFQMAVPSDLYRKEQLLASLYNPKVPVSQFTWGNLVTLKDNVTDDDLYNNLHEFHKRHYSAHRMTLCIQARLPLDTLQAFVLTCFRKVPNNNLPPLNFTQYSDIIYDTPEFNKLYFIIPNKNLLQLEITWVLPSLLHLYKSKPHEYVSWLLGDEGKGSLISYLRKKVWALSIFTGNGETGSEFNSMYSYFSTTIMLTQNGLENVFELITLVYSYINLLKKLGPQQRIFKEIQLIEETSFTFADEEVAVEVVESVSESMQLYPSEHYLTGPELYFEYKPEEIQMVLNHLRPDNMNVMIMNKTMPKDIECNKVEPWFKTRYTYRDIPNKWLGEWANAPPLPEFNLPEPNPFLTTNFNLLPHIKNNPKYPTKIIDTDLIELWYRFNQKFETPTAYIYYHLISPLPLESPINACMLDMFISTLDIQLTEEAYPAQLAELDFSLLSGDRGMYIKLNGYNEKLPVLLNLIIKYIKDVSKNMTPEMFNAVKENQQMNYYNKFLKPGTLNKDLRLSLLINSYWSPLEKHTVISQIDFEMMKGFATNFIKHIHLQGLIQGNIEKKTAVEITERVCQMMDCYSLLSNAPKIRVIQLPKNEHCIRVMSFNKNDTNSVVTNYYQSGSFNVRTSIIIELLLLIIEEPLFDILRTKEQLGYSVYCSLRHTFSVLGYSITVNTQADKHSTQYIDQRIEAFIKHAQKLLKKMTDKKLNKFKSDLIKIKQLEDVLLKEEVDRNWHEIISQELLFDRTEQEIKAIEEIKINELRKFWEEHNSYGNRTKFRKISIQVVGSSEEENQEITGRNESILSGYESSVYRLSLIGAQEVWKEKQSDEYFISNIDSFKHNLFLYPSKTSI